MAEIPDPRFPGAWQNIPPLMRRFLMERLRDRMLKLHGPAGLVMWLFAGGDRANGERIPFAGDIEFYWQVAVEECAVWARSRRVDHGDPPAPVIPPEGVRE